jgi:hypothetical protein
VAGAADIVSAQVQRIVDVNDALYAALNASDDKTEADHVDVWHRQALVWMDLAWVVGTTPARAQEWSALGDKLARGAAQIATAIGDETAAAKALAFARGMPDALAAVLRGAKSAAVAVVKETAGAASDAASSVLWATLKAVPWPVYLLGGVVLVAGLAALFSGRAADLARAVKP